MKIFFMFFLIVNVSLLFSQQKLKGPFLGQKPPGMISEIFALGIITTDSSEYTPAFNPDGSEFFYTIQIGNRYVLAGMRVINGVWEKYTAIPFAGNYIDADLTMSPDGKRVFFWSNRQKEYDTSRTDSDLWFAAKNGDNWGKAVQLDTMINNKDWQIAPTVSSNGNLYFGSFKYYSQNYKKNYGKMDIYKCEFLNGKYSEPINLGDSINSSMHEKEPFIAPDESYIIFNSDREGTYGGMDLYISFKKPDGSWTNAKNMGKDINSPEWDGVPIVSIDSKYLFFSSTRQRISAQKSDNLKKKDSDIYWVDAKVIEKLKKEVFGKK